MQNQVISTYILNKFKFLIIDNDFFFLKVRPFCSLILYFLTMTSVLGETGVNVGFLAPDLHENPTDSNGSVLMQ